MPDRSQNVVDRIHSPASISHFAEYRDNRPVTVREMLINPVMKMEVIQSPYPDRITTKT